METLLSTSTTLPSLPFPLPSSSSNDDPSSNSKKCAYCPNTSKYTCPRCRTLTCSLSCSKQHKITTQCSGERDKAKYIPMNKYGWGSMMDDYSFLEGVGRKVGEWGREIVKGGFDMNVGSGRGGRGFERGRGGRGRGRGARGMGVRGGRGRGGKGKRDILKMFLEVRDVEMELLPNGMERRLLNQSVWDHKNQTALLTIQFKFHPSTEARSTLSDTAKPFTLLTHRNNISTPLLELVQRHVQDRMNKKSNIKTSAGNDSQSSSSTSAFPAWIPSMTIPPPEDPENFTMPTFVIAAPSDPLLLARSVALLSSQRPSLNTLNATTTKPKVYYSLDPNEPLSKSLRGTQFVEFPLIEVWEEFNGVIVDKKTGGVRHTISTQDEEPKRKRRKLNPEEGKKAISGLVGDYGSEDEEDNDEEESRIEDGKNGLVGYLESEAEDNVVDEEIMYNEDEWSDADAEGEIDLDADPAILLELMAQAKREGKWIEEEGDDDGDGDEEDSDDLGAGLGQGTGA